MFRNQNKCCHQQKHCSKNVLQCYIGSRVFTSPEFLAPIYWLSDRPAAHNLFNTGLRTTDSIYQLHLYQNTLFPQSAQRI